MPPKTTAKAEGKKPTALPQDKGVEFAREGEIDKLFDWLSLEDTKDKKLVNKNDSKSGKTCLIVAAEMGRTEMMRMICSNFKANVNFKAKNGMSALLHAAEAGEFEAVEALLEFGAKIDSVSPKNETALHKCCHRGWVSYLNCVKLFISMKFDVNAVTKDLETPLSIAIKFNNLEAAQLLLDAGSDINCKCINNSSIAGRLAFDGRLPLLKFVRERGCDMMATNDSGESPLLVAMKAANVDVIKWFLEEIKCPVDCVDMNGRTGLMFATMMCNLDLMKLLIYKYHCDVNMKDCWGANALFFVVASKNPKALDATKILLDAGTDVNVLDRNFNSPLILACQKENFDIATMLIEYGADDTYHNMDNLNCYTIMSKNPDMRQELEDFVQSIREEGTIEIKEPRKPNPEKPRWLVNLNAGKGFVPIYTRKRIGSRDHLLAPNAAAAAAATAGSEGADERREDTTQSHPNEKNGEGGGRGRGGGASKSSRACRCI